MTASILNFVWDETTRRGIDARLALDSVTGLIALGFREPKLFAKFAEDQGSSQRFVEDVQSTNMRPLARDRLTTTLLRLSRDEQRVVATVSSHVLNVTATLPAEVVLAMVLESWDATRPHGADVASSLPVLGQRLAFQLLGDVTNARLALLWCGGAAEVFGCAAAGPTATTVVDPSQNAGLAATIAAVTSDAINVEHANPLTTSTLGGLGSQDRVFATPPWGARTAGEDDVIRSGHVRLEALALQRAFALLDDGGRAVVHVPLGLLFRGAGERELRKRLLEQGAVEAVVVLPARALKGTAVESALVVLRRGHVASRGEEVLMITGKNADGSARRLDADYYAETLQTWSSWTEKTGSSRKVTLAEIRDHNYDLHPSAFFSATTAEPNDTKSMRAKLLALDQQRDLAEAKVDELLAYLIER